MRNTKELFSLFYNCVEFLAPSVFIEAGCREATASKEIKRRLPECSVFAYEAGKESFDLFHHSICSAGVEHINMAISDTKGEGVFYKHNQGLTYGNNSLVVRNEPGWETAQKVQKDTLDNLHYDPNETFCLWIDVEGHGYEVLQGASNILKNTKLIMIEVEQLQFWKDQKLDTEIIELLSEDFKILQRDQEYPNQYNIIFQRK